MAKFESHRAEERRYLENMPAAIGARAMHSLCEIGDAIGLDYAGVDFGVAPDGSLLLFEANATMVINPPEPGAMWDYRRPATKAVLAAARALLPSAGAKT